MTICALSSGPGMSGVAVIRISGPDTQNILKAIIGRDLPPARRATLLKLNNINNSELIDEALVLWFPAPNSYTGEDMAEFHVHGSRTIISELQNTILSTKVCRLAEPGEFTKLAFLNGKINLLKAESIGDLIASETEMQRRQALKMMSGRNSDKFDRWRNELLKILSHIEAKIDFPDEDLPSSILDEIKIKSEKIKNEIKKILNDERTGERIRDGFKIAIVGPANVGKSSLLNYLSKREVAIVSEFAGTTRDVIETHLNIDGFPVIISDTAGIRESRDEIEKKGIRLALKKAENADLNIVVIEPKNVNFTGFLKDLITSKSLLVVNKSDLGIDNLVDEFKKYNPIYISIKKEKNLDSLINLIKERLKKQFLNIENIFITRERHRISLEDCVQCLENFSKKNDNKDFDKAAEDLRLATRNLGKIVGKVDVEEILGSIFNDFCIGK